MDLLSLATLRGFGRGRITVCYARYRCSYGYHEGRNQGGIDPAGAGREPPDGEAFPVAYT